MMIRDLSRSSRRRTAGCVPVVNFRRADLLPDTSRAPLGCVNLSGRNGNYGQLQRNGKRLVAGSDRRRHRGITDQGAGRDLPPACSSLIFVTLAARPAMGSSRSCRDTPTGYKEPSSAGSRLQWICDRCAAVRPVSLGLRPKCAPRVEGEPDLGNIARPYLSAPYRTQSDGFAEGSAPGYRLSRLADERRPSLAGGVHLERRMVRG